MPAPEQQIATNKSLTLANYHLFADPLAKIGLGGPTIINTLNPHSFYTAESDPLFKKALENCDILLPDGVGVVWAARFLKGVRIERISGMDAFVHLLQVAEASSDSNKKKIFFLGSSRETLSKIKERVAREYPSLIVDTYSPPFKDVFTPEDNEQIFREIEGFGPHLLFVGMTAPKQEKWVFENHSRIQVPVICSIGAAFDYFAGTIKRPGFFWISIGLEWLIRFLREPRRLWKRNLISGPFFVFRMFQLKLNS